MPLFTARTIVHAGGFCVLALGLCIGVIASEQDNPRQRYLAAEQALAKHDRASFSRLAKTLGDYPLRPYLIRSDLLSRLDSASDQELATFLDSYDGEPFTPPLRGAWLRQLARQQRWRAFLRHYQDDLGVSLACSHLEALYRTGKVDKAFAKVPELWLYGHSRPDACDAIFDLWIAAGKVTPSLAWQRIGLALDAGQVNLARYLRRFIPASQRRFVDEWITVHRNPKTLLAEGTVSANNPQAARIVVYGLRNWSRYDSPAAAAAFDTLRQRYQLPAEPVQLLETRLALFLASRGDPDAERRLAAIPPQRESGPVREWRVRTAMRQGRWQRVLEFIEAMPEEERTELRWRYWRARAYGELGRAGEAREIYADLAGHRDYHGFLAADHLGLPYQLGHRPLKVDRSALEAEFTESALRRAKELYRLGRLRDARREWWHHFDGADREHWLLAARIAADWGWSSEAIASAAKARAWNDLELRFPLDYKDRVIDTARREGVEPEWVYAILRQESIFRTDARSSAGALGLMQLMPATAKRVARDLRVQYRGSTQLLEAGPNIRFGTRYLRMSRDDLYDRALLATAGYNAGPHRVVRWLPKGEPMPADLWVELVPFSETRKYLRRVLEYSVIYQNRLKLKPGFLERQMAPIPVKSST